MLFKQVQHAGIERGAITRTVRAWSRPQAKVGNRYTVWTIGLIEVDAVERVTVAQLTDADGVASGFDGLQALMSELTRTSRRDLAADDQVFRVDFHYVGPDDRPRLDLDDGLDSATVAGIAKKLNAMDGRSKTGPWTQATLALIDANPGMGSKELAPRLGRDRMALKADVRKLKKLGLTQSLDVGYRISPRGRAFLDAD